MWGGEGNKLAVLLMEFAANGTRIRDVMLTSLLRMGLSVVGDLDRIALPRPYGWAVELDPEGGLTVRWPHRSPLIHRLKVQFPDVWRIAATRNDAVVLVACCDVNILDGNNDRVASGRGILSDLAANGDLVGAAIGFREQGSLSAA
ncbi:hypothetical protein ALI144C_41090 [Actinosynnema sp. ALI-1.44]|nr:hypothetical protein ALI144C_41090 [Actinosynnema sp. ALI-1.44]